MKLRILPKADEDLDRAALYHDRESGPALALRFLEATEKSLEWLLENPQGGAPREYLHGARDVEGILNED